MSIPAPSSGIRLNTGRARSTGVMYRWRHELFTYMAMAADVKAVRMVE